MQKQEEQSLTGKEKVAAKASAHVTTNSTFIFITVTVFTFIITINNELLKQDKFLAIQLSLAMLLFIYATFSRSKLISDYTGFLDGFGAYIFALAFVLFMNSLGILMAQLISKQIGILFISIYMLMILVYGVVGNIARLKNNRKIRITKEITSLLLAFFLGLLHILNYY